MVTIGAAIAASAAYLVAFAAMWWTLVHVVLWWRHRRPELYARATGSTVALAFALVLLPLPAVLVWVVVDDPAAPWRLAVAALVAALVTGLGWFKLRVSYEVPLAEVRYWSALRRLAQLAAATGGGRPPALRTLEAAEVAAREALRAGGGDAVVDALARVRRTESSFRATREYHRAR
jgi:hypothetical protein